MSSDQGQQPDDLKPGDIRIERQGEHAGTVHEVVSVNGKSVKFKNIKPGKAARRKESFDPSAEHRVDVGQFLTATAPATNELVPVKTQPAFRRKFSPGVAVEEPPGKEIVLLPETRGISVSLILISPDMARNWLDRGGLNRHLNPNRVDGLSAAISRDEWKLTGDTIKLDVGGRVRDGQHRLEAIIRAGIAVWSLVVYGVDEEAFDVMDTGRSRSIADVLGMRGYPDRNVLGSCVRNLIMYETAGRLEPSTRDARVAVTTATTIQYLRLHGDEIIPNVRIAEAVRQDLQGSAGMWAAVITLFKRVNAEDANTFIHKVVTGEGLHHGDPILVLRNRLNSKRDYWAIRSRGDREALAAAIIKTWNSWRRQDVFDSWRQLHWRSEGRSAEAFPRPE